MAEEGTMRKLVAGLVCLGLSLLAVMFARDVWHAEKGLRDGDRRAETGDAGLRAWNADELLPFGVARHALSIDDDLKVRRLAAEGIVLSRGSGSTTAEVRRRVPVETALGRLKRSSDPVTASDAANLLGLLLLTDPADPNSPLESPAQKAVREFRFAVLADPGSDDAKANLEALLQNQKSKSVSGRSSPGGGNQAGKGAAGLGLPGNGF
jgi:hypothetical protein